MAGVAAGTRSRPPESVFASVFPPRIHTTPTPESTPVIGTLASPGAPFGGFNLPANPADEALRLNRAWSSATRYLALSPGFATQPRNLAHSPDAESALFLLLSSSVTRKELLDWYNHDVDLHWRQSILPELRFWQHSVSVGDAADVLSRTVQILGQAQALYLNFGGVGTNEDYTQLLRGFMSQVKQHLHISILHALPSQRVQKTLALYLFQVMSSTLQADSNPESCLKNGRCQCQPGLDLDTLGDIHQVGLGGAHGQRAFAHAVFKLLEGPAIERRCFQVDWTTQSSTIEKLRRWVDGILVPSVEEAVATLTGNPLFQLPVEQFVSVAINSFGRLRVNALFDYVCSWPESQGAIADIRSYLNANAASEKAMLCSAFSDQIQRRLLHAGASTTEILSVYISVIHVFKFLDSRGVLLEKVAIPIRSYLRSRDDTVSTIATSFLAEVGDDGEVHGHDPDKICADIAIAVANSTVEAEDDRLLNWNDMEWVPDPIDAGPNYRSTKSDDVVAYVLGLFDADDFVKALSNALGQHLIHTRETELMRETRLIELLKSRVDASKLQHAEVMLKDVRDSMILNKRINPEQYKVPRVNKPTPKDIQAALPEEGISIQALYNIFKARMESREFQAALQLVAKRRNDLYFPKRTRLPPEPVSPASSFPEVHFEAKIVSDYFWPQLREVDFKIPDQALVHFDKYQQAFKIHSGQRQLIWKHGSAVTDIQLNFEDRIVEENDVEMWKVSIADAFISQSRNESDMETGDDHDSSQGLSASELMEILKLDENYVASGLSFWVNKRVLYEKSEGRYAVLERLDLDIGYVEDASQVGLEAISAVKSEDAMLRENAPMYQNFIDGMLRNSGAKEIEGMMGITSMLKMVMPTFTGGDAEVLWLLEDMEGRGIVKKNGETWSVA